MNVLVSGLKDVKDIEGIVLPYFEGEKKSYSEIAVLKGKNIPFQLLEDKELFKGAKDQKHGLSFVETDRIVEVVLVGLGEKDKFDLKVLRKAVAKGYKALKAKKVESLAVVLNQVAEETHCQKGLTRAAAEAVIMADYKFEDFKSDKKDGTIKEVALLVDEVEEKHKEGCEEGIILGNANLIARKLTNEPANVLTPEELARRATAIGSAKGFEVEVFGLDKIAELGMEAYLSVAKASTNEPRFIVMRYKGNPEGETLGFVGKGLTYDAGGLSIKPTKGMETMKDDMSGSSAVIGAMAAISEAKLNVNVTAVVAACENVIAGNSYKPGDIINSMGGKTIYIGNTDAEGRLTLIDAVHYIINNEKVAKVVDVATLTGAAIHCVGYAATAAVSNNDEFYLEVEKSFKKTGENIWRMPIFDEYKPLLKHPEADLTNTAGSPGTVTAGMFIGEFVGDVPWVHLDIAGSSWVSIERVSDLFSRGGAGVAARPLYFLAKHMSK